MRNRISRCIVAGVLVLAGLSATRARADFLSYFHLTAQQFQIALSNVDVNGNPTSNTTGKVPFYALINTLNGNFAGAARGTVVNDAHHFEYYRDSFTNPIDNNSSYALTVIHDLYVVYSNGYAVYVATGTSTPI